jgi:hypothetical protein
MDLNIKAQVVKECQLGSSGGVAGSLRERYFVKPSLHGVYSLFLYLGVVWLKLGLADLWHAVFIAVPFFLFHLPNLRLHIMKNMCLYTHICLRRNCI